MVIHGKDNKDTFALSVFFCLTHTASTFGRTIFPGVWDVSVMRHGSQASDEIEDDLYQYNIE